MRRFVHGQRFSTGLVAFVVVLKVLARSTDAIAKEVEIVSPLEGATVSGNVPINISMGPHADTVSIYIDGTYYKSAPPNVISWTSTTVKNGLHTISAAAYAERPQNNHGKERPPRLLKTVSTQINVDNSRPSPSPMPTPSGVTYYFSPSGSDSSPCSASLPCWSLSKAENMIARAKPGYSIRFERGGKWTGGITLPLHVNGASGKPITVGNYGSGALPIIDGGYSAPACFYAKANGGGGTPLWSYLTIDGFECRNSTEYGVVFSQTAGGRLGMPGIVVKNMYIHNTGPSYDDGNYRNQLMFLDENKGADGVQFISNVVSSCGGHNCIQVQKDLGAPLIAGNYCMGWIHNCIDVKSVIHAMVKNNIVNGAGSASGAAFYLENTEIPAADATFQRNIVYNAPNGFECEWGGVGSGVTSTCRIYNNTAYLGIESTIVTGGDPSCGKVWLDIRNNILDSDNVFYNGHNCAKPTWDYNDNGATRGSVGGPHGSHDLDGANPRYKNVAKLDFSLSPGSPCIGRGAKGLSSGISDIGAY